MQEMTCRELVKEVARMYPSFTVVPVLYHLPVADWNQDLRMGSGFGMGNLLHPRGRHGNITIFLDCTVVSTLCTMK